MYRMFKHKTITDNYTVVAGDSLYKIALEHHLTLNQLYSYNPGVTPLIFPGDVISLVPQK